MYSAPFHTLYVAICVFVSCSLGINGFVDAQSASRDGWCQSKDIIRTEGLKSYQWRPELLGPRCSLFVRKFAADTAEAVRKLDTEGEAAAELKIVVGLSWKPPIK